MLKQKYYLAAGAMLCSVIIGGISIHHAYADALTPQEDAVINTIDGINGAIQPILDAAVPPAYYTYDFSIKSHNTTGDKMVLDEKNANYAPLYKPETLPAAIKLNKSSVNYVNFSFSKDASTTNSDGVVDLADSVRESISDYLVDNGFEQYQYGNWFAQEYINNETGVVCVISESLSGTYGSYDLDYACGHISWWSMNEDWTNFINAVGSAYHDKTQKYLNLGAPGYTYEQNELPEIYDSTFAPYQYTGFTMFNAYGLFYRSSSTSEWVYFTSTQAVLDCSDFEGETEKGFGGMACYDTETQELSTVGAIKEESPKSPDTGSSTSEGNGNIATISTAIMTGIIVSLGSFFYLFKRQKQFKR